MQTIQRLAPLKIRSEELSMTQERSITFSIDKSAMDVDFITDFLAHKSHWAKGRSKTVVQDTIDNSFCIGMFSHGKQIGFARVLTDYEVFAFIMDVFVDPSYQNQGLGHQMLDQLISTEALSRVNKFAVRSICAEQFYESAGFSEATIKLLTYDR